MRPAQEFSVCERYRGLIGGVQNGGTRRFERGRAVALYRRLQVTGQPGRDLPEGGGR